MSWTERALLVTAVSAGLANLAAAVWTLLRACQTYNIVKKRKD
jgi:predicted membrane-bound spermidine synthase